MIHILSIQVAKIKERNVVTSFDYLISLSFLVFITSFGSWTGLNLQSLLTLVILVILVLQLKKSTRIRIVKPSLDLVFFYLTFSIFQIIFGFTSNFSQKIYVNPDPFGYASVTGAVNRFDSFPNLLNQFKSFTGTNFAYDLNWDDPTQFTKLSSPWLIPDAGIKYGIGNGFYLHNGFSFLLRPLTQGSSLVENFVIGWKFLTIFSAALLLSLILKSIVVIFRRVSVPNLRSEIRKDRNSFEKQIKFLLLGVLLVILALNSRWFPVYIFEGFGNQILSYALCIGTFLQIARLEGIKRSPKNVILFLAELSLLFISQFFVYAQQIPFQLLCLFAGIVYFFNIMNLLKKLHLVLPLLGAAVLLVINIPIVKVATEALSSSGGGGATHLGVLTKLKTIGVWPDSNLQVNPAVDKNGNNVFIDLLWQNSHANGLGWTLRGQGYGPLIESITSVWAQLILSLLFILYLILKINKKIALLFFIMLLPLIILEVFYLYTHTGNFLIKNPNNYFNDYIWMRINAYSSIYIWLLIICLFKIYYTDRKSFSLPKKNVPKNKFVFTPIVLICFLLWSIFNIFVVSKKVDNFSIPTKNILKNCPQWFISDAPNYVISNNMFPQVLITLCPTDIRFISDSFSVLHKADGKVHDITAIKYYPDVKKWEVSKIGSINFVKDIQSPCNVECLISTGMFTGKE